MAYIVGLNINFSGTNLGQLMQNQSLVTTQHRVTDFYLPFRKICITLFGITYCYVKERPLYGLCNWNCHNAVQGNNDLLFTSITFKFELKIYVHL
jgi:hypothetical protein